MSPTTLVATTSVAAPVAQAATGVAYLNVNVPEDAKVYLQDQLMTVGGTRAGLSLRKCRPALLTSTP